MTTKQKWFELAWFWEIGHDIPVGPFSLVHPRPTMLPEIEDIWEVEDADDRCAIRAQFCCEKAGLA